MTSKTILHFKIIEKLGEGGMGVVYKARDLELNRTVALKFLPGYLKDNPRIQTRLRREAQAAASLNHPNICTIYGFHETDEYIFIVMEFIEGKTLKQVLAGKGSFSEQEAIQIITQVAHGLSVAHQNGIIHRDIKSDNIMLTPSGQVKIMDFGLAKMEQTPTITRTKSPMGTVNYMSPELIKGEKVDSRTDLWSLGVVLFEMLTGKLPFDRDSDVVTMRAIVESPLPKFSKLGNRISGSMRYLLMRSLEKDLSLRINSADIFLQELTKRRSKSSVHFAVRTIRKNYQKIAAALVLFFVLSYVGNYYYQTRINIPGWLKKNSTAIRQTDDFIEERGMISPNGNYIAYIDKNGNLSLKDLTTSNINVIADFDADELNFVDWSPFDDKLACIYDWNTITIIDLQKEDSNNVLYLETETVYWLSWSPNGRYLIYQSSLQTENNYISKIAVFDIMKNENTILKEVTPPLLISQPVWFPNSQHIAYYEHNIESNTKTIVTMNINDTSESMKIYKCQNTSRYWYRNGMAICPFKNYLILPEFVNNNVELVAFRIIDTGQIIKSNPIKITNLSGIGIPFWPSVSSNGDILCYNVGQQNHSIFIASLNPGDKKQLENLVPVATNKERFDYEACWSKDGKTIAFLSKFGAQTNISIWEEETKSIERIRCEITPEKHLRYIPNTNDISFISQGKLYRFRLSTGTCETVFPPETDYQSSYVHSYDWGVDCNVLYLIISNQMKGLKKGFLAEMKLDNHNFTVLDTNIVFPDISEISFSNSMLAYRCMKDDSAHYMSIKVCDLKSRERKVIINHPHITVISNFISPNFLPKISFYFPKILLPLY